MEHRGSSFARFGCVSVSVCACPLRDAVSLTGPCSYTTAKSRLNVKQWLVVMILDGMKCAGPAEFRGGLSYIELNRHYFVLSVALGGGAGRAPCTQLAAAPSPPRLACNCPV